MADGAVIRTVAEVMSRPAITADADESVAAATSRMRDRGVGSVVVVEGDKPIGILTERDLVRFAVGRRRRRGLLGLRVDDPRPVHLRVQRVVRRCVRSTFGARFPPHPRGRRRHVGRHRLDARPHARREHRARVLARPDGGAAGAGRRDRRRDRGRRRPRARRASITTGSTRQSSWPRSARSKMSGT